MWIFILLEFKILLIFESFFNQKNTMMDIKKVQEQKRKFFETKKNEFLESIENLKNEIENLDSDTPLLVTNMFVNFTVSDFDNDFNRFIHQINNLCDFQKRINEEKQKRQVGSAPKDNVKIGRFEAKE